MLIYLIFSIYSKHMNIFLRRPNKIILYKIVIILFSVISLYNEQLQTVQNILGRAMLSNIDDFRRNANMLIWITVTALIFIALVEPFLFWANISVRMITRNPPELTVYFSQHTVLVKSLLPFKKTITII